MDNQFLQFAVSALSALLSSIVLLYAKWTREDIQEVAQRLTTVNDIVGKHDGAISRIEQMTKYHQEATDQRLGNVTAKASDLSGEVDRLTRTIELCHNCPHPNTQHQR